MAYAQSFAAESTSADTAKDVLSLDPKYRFTHFFIYNGGSKAVLFNIGDGNWRICPANSGRTLDVPLPAGAVVQIKNAGAGDNVSSIYGDVA